MLDPRYRKRVRRRREQYHDRKITLNFNWFLLFLVVVTWSLVGFMVTQVEPSLIKDVPLYNWYGPFFMSVFAAVYVTIYMVTQQWKQALFLSVSCIVLMILLLIRMANSLNLVILLGLVIAIEALWFRQFEVIKKKLTQRKQAMIESNSPETETDD